jgi:hypothetical protein
MNIEVSIKFLFSENYQPKYSNTLPTIIFSHSESYWNTLVIYYDSILFKNIHEMILSSLYLLYLSEIHFMSSLKFNYTIFSPFPTFEILI